MIANSLRAARRLLASRGLVLWLTVAFFCAAAAVQPSIASAAGMRELFMNCLPLFALTIGQAFVLIAGGIDLSVPAAVAAASVVGASVMTGRDDATAAASGVAATLLVGAGTGAMHGTAVVGLRMPPFLVTLASLMFLGGWATWFTQSAAIADLPDPFLDLWYGRLGPVPYPFLAVAALAVVAHVLLRHTIFGRWLYAAGLGRDVAIVSGVPVGRVVFLAYVACGVCVAVGAMLYMARIQTGKPELVATEILLDSIGAAVIGGASLAGGRGTIAGILVGVLLVTLIGHVLLLFNLSHWHVVFVKGLVILFAAFLDSLRTRWATAF